MGFSYSLENDKKFADGLDRAKATTSNLTEPFGLIAKDFYKSQKAIWSLKGPGQYPDLKARTKARKAAIGLQIYPILSGATHALETAASIQDGPGNLTIIGEKTLIMGVNSDVIKYAIYHQSDQPRSIMPLRKFIFIGPEAPQFATSEQTGRLERWLNILNSFVGQKLKQQGFEVYGI